MSGPVVAFIGKVLVGAAVSHVVTKITGNELIGSIAGMAFGGTLFDKGATALGYGADAAANVGSEIAVSAGTSGGAQTLFGAGTSGEWANFGSAPFDAIGAEGISGVLPAGSAAEFAAFDSMDFDAAGNAITTSGSSVGNATEGGILDKLAGNDVVAETAPGEPSGLLSDPIGWMEKNPGLTQIGAGFIQAGLKPDETDLLREKYALQSDLDAERYAREHQSIDNPDEYIARMNEINSSLASRGYTPQAGLLRQTGYTPLYQGGQNANYKKMLDRQREGMVRT